MPPTAQGNGDGVDVSCEFWIVSKCEFWMHSRIMHLSVFPTAHKICTELHADLATATQTSIQSSNSAQGC